jgi:hypothetical protein
VAAVARVEHTNGRLPRMIRCGPSAVAVWSLAKRHTFADLVIGSQDKTKPWSRCGVAAVCDAHPDWGSTHCRSKVPSH